MFVLFETAAGHCIFKVQDEAKLAKVDDIHKYFETPEKASQIIKLKAFNAFKDTVEAVAAASDMIENQVGKGLKKFLKKNVKGTGVADSLAVTDKALGGLIKEKLGIQCIHDERTQELMRGIRSQMDRLIDSLKHDDLKAMTLGLSHSLSRYKLKFSADKVDIMIVQAIGLLDDLDKEINIYAMRVREWFGWHFPEMGKIVTDNLQYAKTALKMKVRSNMKNLDFSDILDEETENNLKDVCEVSMGTDITEDDVLNIGSLCEQVISLTDYRTQLFNYLKNRMAAIAPNLTVMVGELVGARLIAHAGSLMNLAKHPASTVQILGAEKALFRALKTKHDTPKYGLIYHASLIGQTALKNRGKISRVLAAKTALAIRVDALGEHEEATIAINSRAKVEARMRQLEIGTNSKTLKGNKNGFAAANNQQKYIKSSDNTNTKFNVASDITIEKVEKKKKKKRKAEEVVSSNGTEVKEESMVESNMEKEDEINNEEVNDDKEEVKEPLKKKSKKEKKKKKEHMDREQNNEEKIDVNTKDKKKVKKEKKEKKKKKKNNNDE